MTRTEAVRAVVGRINPIARSPVFGPAMDRVVDHVIFHAVQECGVMLAPLPGSRIAGLTLVNLRRRVARAFRESDVPEPFSYQAQGKSVVTAFVESIELATGADLDGLERPLPERPAHLTPRP